MDPDKDDKDRKAELGSSKAESADVAHAARNPEETLVSSNNTISYNASKFPTIPAIAAAAQNRKRDVAEAKEDTQIEATEPLPLTLHAAPPITDDNNEYTNENDDGTSEEDRRNRDYHDTRPGAVRVAGINSSQISQQSFIYSDQGATEEEAKDNEDQATIPSTVVAEVVDDDQLFRETLTRLQLELVEAENVLQHEVVETENVINVEQEGEVDKEENGKKWLGLANAKRRTIAVPIIVLAVIGSAVAVTAVLVRRSRNTAKQQALPPATATTRPTTPQPIPAPVSLRQTFLSDLLNHNVSSSQDLDQSGTPQNDALGWLVNETFLNATSSVESIIDRYVLVVMYFADKGYNWSNPSNFLSFKSICAWRNPANDTGAFCNALMNVSHGNHSHHACQLLFK
jgi:hypothetical protein